MPVVDYEVHELVREKAGAKYGCWNRAEFAASFLAFDRDPNTLSAVKVEVPHRMSTACRYDHSLQDPKCEGCHRQGCGEDYDEYMRRMANGG